MQEINGLIFGYMLRINPMAKAEDLDEYFWVNDFKVFLRFKNGKRYFYNAYTNTYRQIFYKDDNLTEEEWMFEFKTNLREMMESKFMSQKELADKVGVAQVTISNYVRGERMPTFYMMKKLVKALGCRIEDLDYTHY